MHSIRTKITGITVGVIIVAMVIALVFGVVAIKHIGTRSAEQTLLLLCETGQKNLDQYFNSVEQAVEMLTAYIESDLDGLDDTRLQAHLDRVNEIFTRLNYRANGVLTYYYRIDPAVSKNVKGFWYVDLDGDGFVEHEVTDISHYDTNDTTGLVWFTVPKATGRGVWLPPYITDNLDMRVISYNAPIYYEGRFIGVIGIELDYSAMAEEVNNITLYQSGYAFLNDAEGNLIYHPHMDVAALAAKPSVPEGLLSHDKFIRYTYEGVEKQAVWLPLKNGMHLNVTVPVREINAGWQTWRNTIIVIFAVLLAVFIAMILSLSGHITRPLQKLTAAAEQIHAGNYDVELDFDRQDEVGILTKTIHKVITNLKDSVSELNHLAYVDALTGIRNRMALRKDYDSYLGHEVTVMMVDLNDFKIINDARGHDEGDRILRETAQLLADTFGEKHCYRYGGDEFLVIVPDMPEAEFQEKLNTMMRWRPHIDGTTSAGFSVGYVRGLADKPEKLRSLMTSADEKMYEVKRDKGRSAIKIPALERPKMKSSEYTVDEIKAFLAEMNGKYDLARVVDPVECRILNFQENGQISMNESCYGIWNAEQKCINCSSAKPCRTGCHQEKAEHFQDQDYFIQSNPVKLKLADGSVYDAVVELVNVRSTNVAAHNREEENLGTRASHYLAHHDSLTNVLNADAFYELSRDMVKTRPDIAWVMVTGNIMNFRLINTLFGVFRGNEVLIRTASMLHEITEQARGLCGRLGGDQFAMLLPQEKYSEQALLEVARRLTEAYSSGMFTFCIHFGVYRIDDAKIPVSVMCGRANSALRTIREDLTRTVAYFDDKLLEKTLLEHKVIGGFEEALKEEQFRMYLQPQVRADGRVFGAEALVRWQRPDGSLMMPGDFIETLEGAGLIQKLDMYMWERAVRQLSAWKGTALPGLAISVNMSAKDFYSIDVYDVLTGLVDRYGVDCRLLRLEITETALLAEPEKSIAVVAKLREKGFLVEIDDFGSGYSSLSLLKNIEADLLKVDMGFLREINDKERSRTILRSVIDLAGSLGMDVITEGVETEQQLRALTAMGCSSFQGYYFSRPIPVREFEKKYAAAE